MSSHAAVTAICLADSTAVSVCTVTMRGLLDQGPLFYDVFINHLAGWVSSSSLEPRESTAFPGLSLLSTANQSLFSLCAGGEMFPLVLHGSRVYYSLPVFSPDVILQFNPFDVMQL